jgi:hypothetical protein
MAEVEAASPGMVGGTLGFPSSSLIRPCQVITVRNTGPDAGSEAALSGSRGCQSAQNEGKVKVASARNT